MRALSGSTSPVSSTLVPETSASSTMLALLAAEAPTGGRSDGHSTVTEVVPQVQRSPVRACRSGIPAAATSAVTAAADSTGSCTGVTSTCATSVEPSTADSPPTWSLWKCVSTSRSTRCTSRDRRHAAIGCGSGPVSTTTARPGPVGRTNASPCPTSQPTATHPAGGQPESPGSGATQTSSAPTAEAVTQGRRRTCRLHHPQLSSRARVTAASAHAPSTPSHHSRVPPGSREQTRAIRPMTQAGTAASQATAVASRTDRGASRADTTPRTVVGGTSGAARRLASTATVVTVPCSSTMTGAQMTCAARGTAAARAGSLAHRGTALAIARPQGRAQSTRPSVARVDSAKP